MYRRIASIMNKKLVILSAFICLNVNVIAQNRNTSTKTLEAMGIYFLILIALIAIILIFMSYVRRKSRKIEELGDETYKELERNFNARRIMGELNYIIDEINEYWEQNEYFRKSYEVNRNIHAAGKPGALMYKLTGKLIPEFGANIDRVEEEAKLFQVTKKTLDDYIKKEWNPRIKILGKNSMSYYSDRELRDAFTQFANADREIQKLTIEGEKIAEFNKSLKVTGIALVAVTGIAVGTTIAANRAADRQSFRDHFGA